MPMQAVPSVPGQQHQEDAEDEFWQDEWLRVLLGGLLEHEKQAAILRSDVMMYLARENRTRGLSTETLLKVLNL